MIVFLLKAIFTVTFVFMLLGLAMGTFWTLKIRSLFKPNFPNQPKSPPKDKNVIEGEYKVIDEKEVK